MASSEKRKSFDSLMDEYNNAFGKPDRQLDILRQAADVAKNDHEKLLVNSLWLSFKQRHGL